MNHASKTRQVCIDRDILDGNGLRLDRHLTDMEVVHTCEGTGLHPSH